MELKLNIYAENKIDIRKTHVAKSYDLMLGTVEDIMAIIDVDKMDNNVELTKMIIKGYQQLKPFLFDIFAELTEDDLKYVKVKELIPLFMDICSVILEDLGLLNEGNVERV